MADDSGKQEKRWSELTDEQRRFVLGQVHRMVDTEIVQKERHLGAAQHVDSDEDRALFLNRANACESCAEALYAALMELEER